MNRSEQLRRDFQIGVERACGRPEREVAARYAVTTRTVRRAHARFVKDRVSPLDIDPVEEVIESIQQLDQAVHDLALERVAARNPMTKAVLIMAQVRIWGERRRIFQEIGILPRVNSHYPQLRQLHADQICDWLSQKLRGEGVDPSVHDWLKERLDEWVETGPKVAIPLGEDTSGHEDVP